MIVTELKAWVFLIASLTLLWIDRSGIAHATAALE